MTYRFGTADRIERRRNHTGYGPLPLQRMRVSAMKRLIVIAALLAAGCSPTNPGASGSASTSQSPSARCVASSNPCLALVNLRGSNDFVVSDVTDVQHPKTVSNLGLISWPTFVDARDVSYLAPGGVFRAPLAGSPSTLVFHPKDLTAYAWSPDGKTLAYLLPTSSGLALHLLSGEQDHVVGGSIPARPAVGCETEFCAVADTWDFRLTYSPDGSHIWLVDSIANVTSFRLWTSDGTLVEHSDTQGRSMSAWVGDALYFQGADGVQVWRAGAVSQFLPGVIWIRPQASPNGRDLVYETRDAQGLHETFVADSKSARVRELNKGRGAPVFLTAGYVWYEGERACVAADSCPAGYQVIRSGKNYVYDLVGGTETETDIEFVSDVWPHAA